MLTLHLPPLIASDHLADYSVTFGVSAAHRSTIEVRQKLATCQQELYTFDNIPVV